MADTCYIWVPGQEQPEELRYWNNGPKHARGQDYAFDTRQECFDAADVLRKRGQTYEMEIRERSRNPWLSSSRLMADCF